MNLQKIISGGQTGADEGGLEAAKQLGIRTGGWIPKGYRRLDDSGLVIAKLYGLKEHGSSYYPPRTEQNVQDSDGTVRFASDFNSAGEKCTLRALKKHRRPYIDIDVAKPIPYESFIMWLEMNSIRVLNVAGNSEKTSPGIRDFVIKYLTQGEVNERVS